MKEKALLLLSGGQDSTAAAVWAQEEGFKVTAIIFDYGQKHVIEIQAAKKVAKVLNIPYFVKDVKNIFPSNSALTNNKIKIKTNRKTKLPSTFVPGRNLLFLTIAAMEAYALGIEKLITGVSEEDYSGYPDCRHIPLIYLQEALNQGMDFPIRILKPWINKTKAEEIKYLIEKDKRSILKHTHTCYNGIKGGCGKCPACKLRAKAFAELNIMDPIKKGGNSHG